MKTNNDIRIKNLADCLLLGFYGTNIDDPEVIQVKELLRENNKEGIRGFVLYKHNVKNPEQLKHLIAFLKDGTRKDIIIAIDQEGGKVMRLNPQNGFDLPMKAAADYTSAEEVYDTYHEWGKILSDLGITMNFAPVVDVNINPTSPAIGKIGRSFSSDPKTVASYGSEALKGLKAAGVDGCLKHYPSHGSADKDSHLGFTDITHTWQKEKELYPFIALKDQAPYIMVGHLFNSNIDPEFPASMSKKTYDMLNGFTGELITDCYYMKAISDKYKEHEFALTAINAGADLLIFGGRPILPFIGDMVKQLHYNYHFASFLNTDEDSILLAGQGATSLEHTNEVSEL